MPVEYTKHQRRERVQRPGACAPGSFRVVKSGSAQVVICCPKGKWNAKKQRCRVGTFAQSVRTPR